MSYNTLAEAQLFNSALTQAHIDDAAIYLDARYAWPGRIAATSQAQNWPRVSTDGGVQLDANGRDLVGVPPEVKRAELECALLIQQGKSLLSTAVATASSVNSATVGGQLTHDEVQAGSLKVVEKYSASSSESIKKATVEEVDDNGFPIIKLIDGILWAIIKASSTSASKSNYFLLRA